jgi:DNA repair protein RecN (Recombination protein N)
MRLLVGCHRAVVSRFAPLSREACPREQLLSRETLVPGGYPHRYAQWLALATHLDLDGVHPAERAPGHDLPALLVGAGQHHQQLSRGGVPDTVEAAQLTPQSRAQVGEGLCGKVLAVGARELLDVVEAHEQAAQRGVMTTGSVDLLVQARRQLHRGESVTRVPQSASGVVGVVGSHADRRVAGLEQPRWPVQRCDPRLWTHPGANTGSRRIRGRRYARFVPIPGGLVPGPMGYQSTPVCDPSVCTGTPVRVLCELRVENLLLIEQAELALAPGLNVLTGETGAGKTVLAHALDLLMGGSARPSHSRAGIVRPGAEEAYVEGVFSLPESLRGEIARGLPESVRGEGELEELTIARRVCADGRTRAYLNGRSATVGDLRELGARLISFYGQHEHRKLVLAGAQLQMLDDVCGSGHAQRLDACAAAYRETHRLELELERSSELKQAREHELDLLEHELSEIEALAPDAQEHETLLTRRERLRRLDALRLAAGTAADALMQESPDAPGAAHLLGQAAAKLEAIAGIDPELDAFAERCAALTIEAQDIAGALRGYCEDMEAEDGSLEAVEGRLQALERVTRKHGGTISSTLEHAERARVRREELLGAGVAERRTDDLLAAERTALGRHVEELRASRASAARRLADAVRDQLAALAMGEATFEIALSPTAPKANGGDAVEFVIAPNPGVAAAPLREIASGGELSRVMLALASACNDGAGVGTASSQATLVLDEVDAGIGGHTARAVGERLRSLAQGRQVLCITHLPQIASLAARHFSVAKDTSVDPTLATVVQLAERDVVSELVRMLGAREQDATARRHARDLRRAA